MRHIESGAGGALHVNYRYLLKWAHQVAAADPQARILDYGCGRGQVVQAGRDAGLNFYGCEMFYEGADTTEDIKALGYYGDIVRSIEAGSTGFPDAFFDLVVNNQVFEHVENIEETLGEIHRILKPGGLHLSIFPARDVMREGHIGIPFAHWFPQNSSVRHSYTKALRKIGFGYTKNELPPEQWAAENLDWIDRFTVYRPRREIIRQFERFFHLRLIEEDYIRFRLQNSRGKKAALAPVACLPGVRQISEEAMRRLASMVILARKKD